MAFILRQKDKEPLQGSLEEILRFCKTNLKTLDSYAEIIASLDFGGIESELRLDVNGIERLTKRFSDKELAKGMSSTEIHFVVSKFLEDTKSPYYITKSAHA